MGLLNAYPRLTHLSLTGVAAFQRDDFQPFCRQAPTGMRTLTCELRSSLANHVVNRIHATSTRRVLCIFRQYGI
jgi:hypothetical protein